jgi:hypothetical protein
MTSNSYKIKKGKKSSNSLFSFLENKLKLESMFDGGLPSKYIPHTLFLTAVGIFYIGNNHWAEKTIRKIDKVHDRGGGIQGRLYLTQGRLYVCQQAVGSSTKSKKDRIKREFGTTK